MGLEIEIKTEIGESIEIKVGVTIEIWKEIEQSMI